MMPRLLVVINTATREYGSVEKQQLNSSNNSATMEQRHNGNSRQQQHAGSAEAEVKRVGESSINIHSNNNERRLRNDDDELLGDDYE